MAFSDLSAGDAALVQSLDAQLVRPTLIAARSALAGMRKCVAQLTASQAALDQLSDDDVIAYAGGLAGATPVSKAQLAAMLTQFAGLLAAWDTAESRAIHVPFIGGANIDG